MLTVLALIGGCMLFVVGVFGCSDNSDIDHVITSASLLFFICAIGMRLEYAIGLLERLVVQ